MSRRKIHTVLLGLVVLVAAGGAGGWWYMAIGRFPLAGDTHHDFGEVAIVDSTVEVSHTFELRNRTGDPLVIESIRPGCGCTSAVPSTYEVAPGETVDIDIVLGLDRAGRKKTSIKVTIEGFGVQTLWIKALARKELGLTTSTPALRLTRAGPNLLLVTADIQSHDAAPPKPAVTMPDGVEATFLGWEPVRKRDPETMRPARWRGRYDLVLTGDGLPQDQVMIITLEGVPPLRIGLNAASAEPAPGDA